jgi:PAS domain S-box-containing protein
MTKIHWKANYIWPLSGPTVSARLLRVLLPLIISAILIQGFLDETITRLLNINEALFTALLSLTFAIITAIVIVQLSRSIFRQAEKTEIERKRTEEKNLQLASIIESTDDAIIGKTLDGTITNWNFGAERMYGYTKEEIINQPISLIIPPDHQDEMTQILEKIRGGQHIDHYETMRQRKDGTQINISVSISPIYNVEGTLIGASTIARDITKHKRAEEELRKLSRAVEQSPASIVVTDTSGAIEYVNAKFIQVTGYMLEEAVGKNPRILKSGEKPAEEYRQLWDMITSGGEWRGEFHNKKKNGELYWESAIISPIKDERGIITHFLGVKEDITERKQAEKKIHESEENFRAIFENNSSAIAIIEPDTTISMVNDAYCQMSGYTKQEVVGMSWTQQILPDDLERMKEYNRRRLINPQDAPDKYEFKFYKKSGEIRYGLMSISFMQSARKIITSFIDITDRKIAEEEGEKLINELKAALADIKTLSGLLPICASCKKIRDDNGYWQQVEGYIQKHSEARFTHGLCPDCTVKYFPEYVSNNRKGLKK